jgi:hypothetical protein
MSQRHEIDYSVFFTIVRCEKNWMYWNDVGDYKLLV